VTEVSRRSFLAAIPAAAAAQAPKLPNFLLLMTDQQSHSAWSGAGNPWLSTPAMDSIAARGVVFTEAHVTYPVCSPSRSSIFTSRMPHETGVMENGTPIATGIPTMGEIFREAGYKTVYGGKWHLPKSFAGMTAFDQIAGGNALGATMDAPLAGACVKWLDNAPAEPFVMVASFMNPHDVCDWIRQHPGTRRHENTRKYPPAPGNMGIDPLEPDHMRYHRTAAYDKMSEGVKIASDWQRDDVRQYLHDYYRMVEDVDRQIGRVLDALRRRALDRNTIVIFCSDHGEGLGAHRWVQKAAFWDEVVRVPFMIAGPGIPAGTRVPALTTLNDILPTMCEYAGIKPPAGMRGASLRAAMSGGTLEREFVVSELRYGPEREGRMLRTARYKYTCFDGGSRREQLFDLEADPGETRNLVGEPGAREVLARHRSLLAGWCKQTEDNFRLA
jgi:arylsulfatase A-like enzyme